MVTTAEYDADRPVGSSRHTWIDMGCLCGKVNISYRVDGHPGHIVNNMEGLAQIVMDLLTIICDANAELNRELPDVTEAVVKDEHYTVIVRFEVVGSDIPVISGSIN
jgi:hypothetical protein